MPIITRSGHGKLRRTFSIPGISTIGGLASFWMGHIFGHGPPQSIPSSSWFWTPSKQLGFMHGWHGPPQSIAVSPPFCTPSKHVGTYSHSSDSFGFFSVVPHLFMSLHCLALTPSTVQMPQSLHSHLSSHL